MSDNIQTSTETRRHPFGYGARRNSDQLGPRALLKQISAELGKGATNLKIERVFTERVKENEDFLDIIISYWVTNNIFVLYENAKKEDEIQETKRATDRIAREKLYAGLLSINLLTMRMPNGKILRDCTGDEIKELKTPLSRFLNRLADHVAPGATVGQTFKTDKQLRKLWADVEEGKQKATRGRKQNNA